MEGLIDKLISILVDGQETVLALGWIMFLIERYYVAPKREAIFRKDLADFRKDYQQLGEKMAQTLSQFTVMLEVLKERVSHRSRPHDD